MNLPFSSQSKLDSDLCNRDVELDTRSKTPRTLHMAETITDVIEGVRGRNWEKIAQDPDKHIKER